MKIESFKLQNTSCLCAYLQRHLLHAICLVVSWELCLHEKYVLMLFAYMPTCHDFMLVANMLIACINIKVCIPCALNTNTLSLISHNVLNFMIWILTLSTYDRLLRMHLQNWRKCEWCTSSCFSRSKII